MTEIPTGVPENQSEDETLKQFPDLQRARELFIELFRDKTALVNLGYSSQHIAFAMPVLRRIADAGIVETYIKNKPFLTFDNPDDANAESSQIYRLDAARGHYLNAFRDETLRFRPELSDLERVYRSIFGKNPVQIFPDFESMVAHIALYNETVDLEDLRGLVQDFCSFLTDARGGLRDENLITQVARKVGIVGTYRSAWVDDRTKLEFVVRLDVPEEDEPEYHIYRRLNAMKDSQGTVVPFGKKANINLEQAQHILESSRRRAIGGQLVVGGAS